MTQHDDSQYSSSPGPTTPYQAPSEGPIFPNIDYEPPRSNALATWSMVLGITGIVLAVIPFTFCMCCPFVEIIPLALGILATTFGTIYLKNSLPAPDGGRMMARSGQITGIASIVVVVIWGVIIIVLMAMDSPPPKLGPGFTAPKNVAPVTTQPAPTSDTNATTDEPVEELSE